MADGQVLSWTVPLDSAAPAAPADPNAAPSLFPSAVESRRLDNNFFLYYQRPVRGQDDDGWIVAKPGWPNERAKWTRKGWIPLDQYGRFIPGADSRDVRDVKFSAFHETYRVFFQKGGAAALPVSQIIAFGWHRRPPYREVTFPQMDGVTWHDYECPSCNHPPFNTALNLADHVMIRHDWKWADLRAYGQEKGYDFSKSANLSYARATAPASVAEAPTLTPTADGDDFACPDCGKLPPKDSKSPKQSLAMHRRNAHKELLAAASASEKGK